MDRPGASLEWTVAMIRERLRATAVALQLPVVVDGELRSVIDLVSGEMSDFAGNGLAELSPQLAEAAAAARQALIEATAEADDELLAAYLDGQPITTLALRAALRRATLAGQLVPVLYGSALRSRGISQLLDAVVDYLPSPLDVVAERPADPAAPLVAFVFKVVSDVHIGQLSYVRVYSGTLAAGSYVLNAARDVRERVGQVLRVHADDVAALPAVGAGDIVALVGPRQSVTGDTLCDPAAPVVLTSIQLPEPVIRLAIEPRSSADRGRLSAALQRLAVADPTFHVGVDAETGQTVVAGMGELHLEIQLERLRLDYGVEVRAGQPEVAYRETIRRAIEVEHTLARQSGGGSGQWARVRLRLEPGERGAGFAFAEEVVGGAVPRQFIPAVEAGVRDAVGSGVKVGYPVIDLRATLAGGAFHPVDSSELAFRTAAAQAFCEAMRQAEPLLLEPLMRVEVVAPDEYLGAVLGDLGGRRGRVVGIEPGAGASQLVRALIKALAQW
jgi:elongation factor G